jgi:predicted RNA-binding Zn-ribbon protein involved in translation (DUF1610 family)
MISKSFLEFIEEHEKKLDDFIREDSLLDEEEVVAPVIKKVAPKPIQKSQVIKVQSKVIKESSVPFSFCTSCGNKLPANVVAKFCPSCGKQTLMSTDQKVKTASRTNSISENVDYASKLLDEENPMDQSRLLEYLEKNPVKNPVIEMLKANRGIGKEKTVISETADYASDLLDGSTPVGVGGVQLLEMPDFSKFMPLKPVEEKKIEVVIDESKLPKIMQPITQINDPNVEAQMRQLGLL